MWHRGGYAQQRIHDQRSETAGANGAAAGRADCVGQQQHLLQLQDREGPTRDAVVFVSWPSQTVRTLGFVTGTVSLPDTDEAWLAVVFFSTAGQIKGGTLRVIDPALVTRPGWTISEAMAFITSSGALSPATAAPT